MAAKLFYLQNKKWGFDSAVGMLMVHAYEAFQVEVGLSGNILSAAYTSVRCLATDGTCFKNLWEFANKVGVTVELPQATHFEPIRENDRSLMGGSCMTAFLLSTVAERQNQVRKYKGMVHVSNKATCDGNQRIECCPMSISKSLLSPWPLYVARA